MNRPLFLFGLIICLSKLEAQEDLLAELEGLEEARTEFVTATFKGTQVINAPSNELPGAGVLQFVFQHRFGSLSDDFFYNFLGLDNADVRLGFDYALNDRLQIGLGRSSFEKTYDASSKIRILRQSTGPKALPLSMTVAASVFVKSLKWTDGLPHQFSDRLSYSFHLVISRKFSESFSLAFTPSLVHFNLVDRKDQANDVVAIGLGGRYKLNRRISINAEYFPQLNQNSYLDQEQKRAFFNSFSLGFDIETGGHVFQLFFSNSRGVIAPQYIAQTSGSWKDGDVYFGFNISRVFTLKKPDLPTYK